MNIGLDWDGTFTADPKVWQKFIDLMVLAGHDVYITTSRDKDTPIEFIPLNLTGVIYCAFEAKKDATIEQGIFIDVWVDNDPYYIDHSFLYEPPKLLLEKP